MPYLIDGHNLIPKVPGLSLRMMDDEIALIEQLKVFCKHSRKTIEVYFDQAPPNVPRKRSFGMVKAIFVPAGQTADDAIYRRLKKLGGQAQNWTVVSSDRQVQTNARAAHARVMTSEQFAIELAAAQSPDKESAPETAADTALSEDEVAEWLTLFEEDHEED